MGYLIGFYIDRRLGIEVKFSTGKPVTEFTHQREVLRLVRISLLAVDVLKIDKSFVIDLAHNREDEIIVRSTIELAHNLGLKVVAEGVEDQQSLAILQGYCCDLAQGYYFSRPIPIHEFNQWLQTSPWGLPEPTQVFQTKA